MKDSQLSFKPSGVHAIVKRMVDVGVAGIGLVVALPLMLGIGLAIRLDSPGPALFRQRRVGRGSSEFVLLKFRSMAVGTPDLATHLVEPGQLSITRLGRVLRRTSLDELPQLWNVLKGEMSLVGPRPITDEEVEKYGGAFEVYKRVKGGITGLWQVSGRNDVSYDERVYWDLFYVRNWSVWLDLCILFRTIAVVQVSVFSVSGFPSSGSCWTKPVTDFTLE